MNTTLSDKLPEIRQICKELEVKSLFAFGSVLSTEFNDQSDIDLLVCFNEIPAELYTDNYFTLHDRLEKLFSKKIDLVTENSLHNPYFIQSINQSKELLYAA